MSNDLTFGDLSVVLNSIILALLKAGFTRDEIIALINPADPAEKK